MKKRVLAWLCMGALLLGLAGCGTKSQEEKSKAEEDTRDSITAYVGTNIFEEGLDPVKGAMSHGYPLIGNALLQVDPQSNYVGDLATDWSVSDDGLTYTYQLREGVTFSDGTPFTAEDVVFTYEEVKTHQANNGSVDLTRLDSVEAQGDYTVVFRLKEPYSPFFDTTAQLQIVPSDSYDGDVFNTAPVGTGPWQLVQYDANQQIILRANENYYGGAPALRQVTLVYMDPDAAFASAKSGQLDVVMVGSGYAGETIEGMTLIPFETMDVRNISLPVTPAHEETKADGTKVPVGNDVTSDPAVREALAIGIQRQQIIDDALNGVGRPAVNFTDNLVWADADPFEDGRAQEACALLEAAGWVDTDGDGVREKEGLRCSFVVYAPSGDMDRYQLATALSQNAQTLGIEIVVKSATWDEITAMEYAAGVVWGWGQYSPTVLRSLFSSEVFLHGMFDNVVGFSDPQVDEEIAKALAATDPQETIGHWKEVQRLADAQYPYLYLVNIQHCYFVKDGLDLSLSTQIPHPHGHGAPVICNMKDWKWK